MTSFAITCAALILWIIGIFLAAASGQEIEKEDSALAGIGGMIFAGLIEFAAMFLWAIR